jgi:hypothetical protein
MSPSARSRILNKRKSEGSETRSLADLHLLRINRVVTMGEFCRRSSKWLKLRKWSRANGDDNSRICDHFVVFGLFGCSVRYLYLCQWIDIYLGIAAARFRCFVLSTVDVNRLRLRDWTADMPRLLSLGVLGNSEEQRWMGGFPHKKNQDYAASSTFSCTCLACDMTYHSAMSI